jgi:hypothetical protein
MSAQPSVAVRGLLVAGHRRLTAACEQGAAQTGTAALDRPRCGGRTVVGAARHRGCEDQLMGAVTRLLTFVDINDANDAGPDARSMSVTARQEAVLADGRRVVLLDDRGWSGTQGVSWDGERSEADRRRLELDSPGIWASETVEEIERTARVVVGPDEPFEGRSQADIEADHWDTLARILRQHGVEVAAAELKALPHDVELSDRVLGRVGRGRRDAR